MRSSWLNGMVDRIDTPEETLSIEICWLMISWVNDETESFTRHTLSFKQSIGSHRMNDHGLEYFKA